MLKPIEHFILESTLPTYNDKESVTVLRLVGKNTTKINEIVEYINNTIDSINLRIEEFESGVIKSQEEFECEITKIMHDYIIMIDEKIKLQDNEIADISKDISNQFIEYMDSYMPTLKSELEVFIDEKISQAIEDLEIPEGSGGETTIINQSEVIFDKGIMLSTEGVYSGTLSEESRQKIADIINDARANGLDRKQITIQGQNTYHTFTLSSIVRPTTTGNTAYQIQGLNCPNIRNNPTVRVRGVLELTLVENEDGTVSVTASRFTTTNETTTYATLEDVSSSASVLMLTSDHTSNLYLQDAERTSLQAILNDNSDTFEFDIVGKIVTNLYSIKYVVDKDSLTTGVHTIDAQTGTIFTNSNHSAITVDLVIDVTNSGTITVNSAYFVMNAHDYVNKSDVVIKSFVIEVGANESVTGSYALNLDNPSNYKLASVSSTGTLNQDGGGYGAKYFDVDGYSFDNNTFAYSTTTNSSNETKYLKVTVTLINNVE